MSLHKNVFGIILIGYGMSSVAGCLIGYRADWSLGLLVFWIGGGFATLGVACIAFLLSDLAPEYEDRAPSERPLQEQLDLWDEDRAREHAEAHVENLRLLAEQETSLHAAAARSGRVGKASRSRIVLPPPALLHPPTGPEGD